ncbi:MAG: hypothetical protein QN160_09965 [Armatimonadota bacterium]|nr:hypothetical protein [Armatimonadota bacterium]MDR7574247.1 hypothetical protein [Armatimonadota bacterium]
MIEDLLWRYVGLRPFHLQALRDLSHASPAVRRALRDGGLIDEAGRPTLAGEFALRRAEEIVKGRFAPPAPILEIEYRPGMARRVGLPGTEARLLAYIGRHPEVCLRFLRLLFGNPPLKDLRERGLINVPEGFSWTAWSTPVRPSAAGVERLRALIPASYEPIRDGFQKEAKWSW